MMLALDLSYTAFIMLRYISSLPVDREVVFFLFIMKGFLILSSAFFLSSPKDSFSLLLEREEKGERRREREEMGGRERERERETSIGCLQYKP